jgi:hypothetical protein
VLAGWDRALADADLRAKDARHRAVATRHGLKLLAYESALTVRGDAGDNDPRDAVQTLPAAGERQTALLAYQEQAGFDGTALYYAIGKRRRQKEGHYPLAESLLTLTKEPKYSAAAAFAAARSN